MLVLHALNTDERIALPAASDDGGFDALSLDRAAHLLRDQRTGKEHPVYPPVLDLLYRAQRTFSAPLVRIVSGYRAPRPTGRGTSNHGRGRATDIVVPGVADETLAEWARGQGFVGVGIYPVGKFCHLDVRPQSYFWRDTSGPGQRSRETRLRGGGASAADLKSHKAGQSAFPAHAEPAKQVDAAWRKTPTPLPPVVSPEPEGPEDH